MTHEAAAIEVTWGGPYGWPGFEDKNSLPPIPNAPGVYLQTFEFEGGYLIYAAGITLRPVPTRFREHTRKYMNGEYNVLDIDAAQRGVRQEVWHGWGYAREHREQFEQRRSVIVAAVRRQLAGFRVFVGDVGTQRRILQRVEASIMLNLYEQPSPICDIPDRGMQLAPRWNSENHVVLNSSCASVLHGLPACLEV